MMLIGPMRTGLLAAALLFWSVAANADEAVIERWYTALLNTDRAALSELLTDEARISLTDLGVVQTKQEFIASMDEWESAVAGGQIRHRIAKSEGGVVTVIACYDFPANDMLMQETFALTDNRITATSQAAMAETCDAY
nr:nuclear transport factor 2 family protein [Mesorhizobium sp. Root157]